ncbi:transposase [Saccharopolyspora elongata]|uniref:transposase n=1 Tax=Saccharopolyspora elongata TaxID=2530387 RepID=UPI001405018E|nr:transposase [Saccharopolyspora elongata]
MGRPSKFSDEFKRDAVELVRSTGRPINQVARELGLSRETLRNWVRAAKRQTEVGDVSGADDVADKDAELARLRKRVAELETEKEILRKAAAYFALVRE